MTGQTGIGDMKALVVALLAALLIAGATAWRVGELFDTRGPCACTGGFLGRFDAFRRRPPDRLAPVARRDRDGVSRETGLLPVWLPGGPRVAWRAAGGTGYSSPCVVRDRVYTMVGRRGDELVICLDAADGREILGRPVRRRPHLRVRPRAAVDADCRGRPGLVAGGVGQPAVPGRRRRIGALAARPPQALSAENMRLRLLPQPRHRRRPASGERRRPRRLGGCARQADRQFALEGPRRPAGLCVADRHHGGRTPPSGVFYVGRRRRVGRARRARTRASRG